MKNKYSDIQNTKANLDGTNDWRKLIDEWEEVL